MARRSLLTAVTLTGVLLALEGCAATSPGGASPARSVPAGTAAPYGRVMTRDRLYDLIAAARDGDRPESPSADPDALREVLAALDPGELSGYVLAFDDELIRLNRWSVWGAGYVANGGMGDDDFHYFRCWLIGKGRGAVDAVLDDPDALADHLDEDGLENEELEYVGLDLLEQRGLPDPRDVGDRASADDEPSGRPFDEGAVESAYPRTAAASG